MAIARLYSPSHEIKVDPISASHMDIIVPALLSVSPECTIYGPQSLSDVTPPHWSDRAMHGYVLEMGDTPDAGILHILSKTEYGLFGITPDNAEKIKYFGPATHIHIPQEARMVPALRLDGGLVEIGAIIMSATMDELTRMRQAFDPNFRGEQQ